MTMGRDGPPMRLVLDDGPTLEFDDLDGFYDTKFDLGYPSVREAADDRPQGNGTDDRTRYFGARAVSLEGTLAMGASRSLVRDRLAPFLVPGARPWLVWRDDQGSWRRVGLRADQWTHEFVAGPTDWQVSWKAPTGVIESADPHTVVAPPEVADPGFTLPLVLPLTFPPAVRSDLVARNAGSVAAEWVAHIYGPCANPALINGRTDERIVFDGLTIAAGEWVQLDSRQRSVLAMSDPKASRYHLLDFRATDWWLIQPGDNDIRLVIDDFQEQCRASVTWRDTYLL